MDGRDRALPVELPRAHRGDVRRCRVRAVRDARPHVPSTSSLRLTATDSFGRSTTKSQNLTYATVSLALRTSPSGGKVTLDDIVYTTPANVTVLKGSNHQLTVSNTQTIGGSSRTFIAWSDGGAASHMIHATASKTLTAWYTGGDVTTKPKLTLLQVTGLAGSTAGATVASTSAGRIRLGWHRRGGL